MVTVGDEENLIVYPHRHNILCLMVSYVLNGLSFRVPNPDIISLSTSVMFPSTELTEGAVVCQEFSIRGIATKSSFWKWNSLTHTSLGRNGPKASRETITGTVSENDALAIRIPPHNDVVRTHTITQVVTTICSCISQTYRFTSIHRKGVNFAVSIIFTGKGKGFTIGRETGKHFIAHMRGQSNSFTTINWSLIKVSCIGENHFSTIGSRETKQSSVLCMHHAQTAKQQCRNKKSRVHKSKLKRYSHKVTSFHENSK